MIYAERSCGKSDDANVKRRRNEPTTVVFYSLISLLICPKQTNGDRDMRGFITLSLLMASGVAVANENLVCEYAVGDFSSPPTLLTKGSANVIFNGKSFTAYRPGGSYVVSPPLTEKKDGMIFIDDKTKVFAASQDKSNFAVSDRIKKPRSSGLNAK